MRGVEYVQRVSQVRDLARRYWFDVLVAVLAIVAMLEVVLGRGSPGAPRDDALVLRSGDRDPGARRSSRGGAFRSRVRRCTGCWPRGFRSSIRC